MPEFSNRGLHECSVYIEMIKQEHTTLLKTYSEKLFSEDATKLS